MELTVAAVPIYFGGMGIEYAYLRRRARADGRRPTDYERRDTIASLSMGVGSLLAPIVMPRLLNPVTPGRGRFGRAMVGTALAAATATTAADLLARAGIVDPADRSRRPTGGRLRSAARWVRCRVDDPWLRRARGSAAASAVVAGGTALCTTWAAQTTATRLWEHRRVRDLGAGAGAMAAAIAGWDLIYYWNHRLQHESRFLWAIHVVHHSSERYNLSTALRQPVADAFGMFVPYGLLSLAGIRPAHIETARGVNLLYQFWIHTDTIGSLDRVETVLNTPSHHRVHHGSNRQYLDRNHGSILIIWDKLFGTFEPEGEPVTYGLTRNLDTFNPARIASHEHADMLADVASAPSWRDRLSFVLRGPGWAARRRAELGAVAADQVAIAA